MAIKKPSENTMICSTIIEYLASTVASKHADQSRPHWRRSQSPRSGRSELVFPWPTFSGRRNTTCLHVCTTSFRSEERRVGKEGRFRWSGYHVEKRLML